MILMLLAGFSLDASAQGGSGMGDAIPIPINSCYSSYFSDYQYNGSFNDLYGQPNGDVWYTFTVSSGTYVEISLCNSDFDTYVSVIDPYYNLYATNDDDWSSCGWNTSYVYQYFPPGTYYIVAEGSGYATGTLALSVATSGSGTPSAGANMGNAISAGTFGSTGTFTDTRSNTDDCLGNDIGQPSNDIYYSFTLTGTATVTLTHCGSAIDTYMHLLDAYGSTIATNDDEFVSSPCPSTRSYIQATLSAGTYYVVSEGYSTWAGDIVTNITVSGGSGGSVPAISYTTPSVFAVGAAITPLSPTNTGGAVSAGGQTTSTFVSSGLNNPISTAVDAAGNIYVADAGNHSIRKITPSGTMSLLAGAGYAGYADGTGSGAVFRHPTYMAVDASGNVFVSDQQNHRIRKITPSGVVTTFAGSGSIGSADGTGTSASFQYPMGLAFDASGNLFVADAYNQRIRRITPLGTVSTFAGTGGIGTANGSALSSTFNYPMGLTFDAAGNLYVADRHNQMVRKISTSGTVSTLAGSGSVGSANGTGTSASFNSANGVAVDGSGNVYLADQGNNMIRKISPAGVVTTLAGTTTAGGVDGTGAVVRFTSPYGICINSQGELYVAENAANRVRKIVLTKGYSISPALPAGLVFNEDTGVISGTPSVPLAATVFTVTAYNNAGSSTATLSIAVSGSCPVPSHDQNYVINYVPREEGLTTTSAVISASCNPFKVQTEIEYFDGLGRSMQSVQVKGSAAADKDIVVPKAYDDFGRETKKYLPYASTGGNGSYKTDGLTKVIDYYAALPAGQASAFSTPFSESRFDTSPLNRLLEQGAPGTAWQIAANNTGHTLKTDYGTNLAGDVKIWTVTSSGATAGFYGANKLLKTTVKDENWEASHGKGGTTDEYTDFQGKIVLKRVWETDSKSLSTYYVYDDLENLRYVLPPAVNENTDRLVGGAIGSFDEADDVFKQFIYGYHYDSKKRVTEKKLPGKDWEFIVYNSIDQVILSQDWKLRSEGKWLFSKYDVYGNVIITGLYADGGNRSVVQGGVDNLTINNPNYRWWEVPSGSGVGYSNDVFPQSINYYHSINYYGSYSFPGNVFGLPNTTLGQVEEARARGLLTASSVTVLGTGSMLLTVNYYDPKGRVIQSKSQHYKNNTTDQYNYDEITNVYTFNNELKESTRKHFNNNTEALYVYNKYEYDHMGRKLSAEQKTGVNSSTTNPLIKLSGNSYDEIGRLVQESLHNGLQNTSMFYNERGWLAKSESSEFSFKLHYQDGTAAQYNGNVANQGWGAGASYPNLFTYGYDKLSRLENAVSGGVSEIVTYDVMGNITSMNRDGAGANAYQYTGNRLKKVNNLTVDYDYNDNGNAILDGRTGAVITYNHLDLPSTVTLSGSNLSYLYDASGRKLRKSSSTTGTIDYIDGIHYKPDGTIDFVQTEVGLVRRSGGDYNYEYTLNDHLGNARYSFDIYGGAVRRIQQQDYYPFGKIVSGQFVSGYKNNYLYNSKELQEELGQLDYGARFYDPEIGRWNVVDPLSEKGRRWSPYTYAFNNPIRFVDPDGRESEDWVKTGNIWTWNDNIKTAEQAKAAGYDDYRAPGSIVENTKLGTEGKPGNIYLGENASDAYYVLNTVDIRPEVNMGTGETQGALGAAVPIALTSSAIDGPLPIGEVIGAGVIAGAAVHDAMTRVYVTYTLTNASGQIYVGRSSGYGDPQSIMMNRYAGHHMRALGYGNPQLDRSAVGYPVGYYAIRGREQDYVTSLGGIGSPRVGNSINPIWQYNPNRPLYLGTSKLMFGPMSEK